MSTEPQSANISSEKLIGNNINGYQIVERIDESQVFLAFKEDSPTEQVAFKVFYPDPYACNQELILERLQAVKNLDHEYIVKVFEVGEYENFIYAVMEYVQGEDLYDLMQRNPRLHWGAAAELARDIVTALVEAHKNGVLHLCLHPDRILLSKAGQLKVTFCNEGEITPSKEIVQYVAPELFLGKQLEACADIYALGAIIYNIVIGKAPLAGKEPKDVAIKHREKQPVLPSYGVQDIPHWLSVILSRSLHAEPKKRYQYCYEMLSALRNFLINDIGIYKMGSYKELFKRVEVSEAVRSFTRKVSIHQRKVVGQAEEIQAISREMLAAKPMLQDKVQPEPITQSEPESKQRVEHPIEQETLPISWKIILACVISFVANIALALLVKSL